VKEQIDLLTVSPFEQTGKLKAAGDFPRQLDDLR
jgi:hypothetical protein